MTTRLIALALALCVGAFTAHATPKKDPVDFTGVWWPARGPADFKPDPVLTPEAQKTWDEIRSSMAKGVVVQDSTAACIPPGTPRLMTRVYPIQWIRYEKGYVLIHEYENTPRWFFMDGRAAPTGDDLLPTFNGYSVARWDGDVLVVETTGFKPASDSGLQVWIQLGVKVTPQLKLEERYRLGPDGKTMEVQLTMTDPEILAKPWIAKKVFELRPNVEIMEYTCLPDENVVTYKDDGSTTFKDLKK